VPEVEIGMGRTARSAYDLADVTIVPSRRTRSSSDISTAWQIDAYRFDIPLLTQPTDAIVSPEVATAVAGIGGLGVLDGEGLWARYPDPQRVIDELLTAGEAADDPEGATVRLQELVASGDSLVVCSHRPLLPALLKQLGVDTSPLQPAAFIVGHRRSDGTVASFERHRV